MSEPLSSVGFELIPGKLSARVVLHAIPASRGPIACWSYVTDGLIGQQHAELVFTLRRQPDEPDDGFPEDPLELFVAVYQLAERGQRVTSGGVTQFGERRLFGHHLLYVSAQPMAGIALPASCLAALLVTDDELRAARELGSTRVLARMGQATTHYPFPPWNDRQRRGLSLDRTFEASLLSKMQRASAHGLHVGVADDRITLSALRSEASAWQDRLAQLPDAAPFALLTSLDPAAHGCLVWVPGQQEPEAIVPPGPPGPPGTAGSRVGGCFIAFLVGQPDNGGKILEDGFAMELTGEAWQALCRALVAGEELAIPATAGGMPFALTWRDDSYVSPIDGQNFVAEGGWTAYQPARAGEAMLSDGRVTLGQLRLLTSQAELAARTTADGLAVFCRELQRCTARVLADHAGHLELLLRVTCTPSGHQLVLARQGEVSDATLQALVDALHQIARLAVRDAEVSFELQLTVAAAGAPS